MSAAAVSQPNGATMVPEVPGILQAALDATQSKMEEIQRFELKQREARLFSVSGLFADIKGQSPEQSIAQAFVKISLGESMGFNAAEAMTGIDVIQGRIAINANMRAAKMQRAGYDWDILQLDENGCRLRLKYKGQILLREQVDEKTGSVTNVPAVVAFLKQDAINAGLLGKDMYKKYPPNMYFARAITNAQRWYAPGVLSVSILSAEEAMDLPVADDPPEVEGFGQEVEKLFVKLEMTDAQVRNIKGKHIGRPGELKSWLEKQLAKKQNTGAKPAQDEKKAEPPAQQAEPAKAEAASPAPEAKPDSIPQPTPPPAAAVPDEW